MEGRADGRAEGRKGEMLPSFDGSGEYCSVAQWQDRPAVSLIVPAGIVI